MRTFSYISIILFGFFHFGWSARISIGPHLSYPNAINIVCEPDTSDTTVVGVAIYKERLYNMDQQNTRIINNPPPYRGKPKVTRTLYNPTAADVGVYRCQVRYSQNGKKYYRSDLGLLRADYLRGIERCYSIYENCQKGYTKPPGAHTPCVADMVNKTYTCLQYTETQCDLKLTQTDVSKKAFKKLNQNIALDITLNDAYKPSQGCS